MRITRVVASSPGIHLRELQRALGLSLATVRHHARKLVQAGVIELFPHGGRQRLFPKGFPDSEKALVSATRGAASALVLRAIVQDGMSSNGEISSRTGLAKSTVTKYLHLFLELGIVATSVPMGDRRVHAVDSSRVAQIFRLSEARIRLTVDNYAELWDF
jgi:predicted transcriptional regulator